MGCDMEGGVLEGQMVEHGVWVATWREVGCWRARWWSKEYGWRHGGRWGVGGRPRQPLSTDANNKE